jgi:hypothetical protein
VSVRGVTPLVMTMEYARPVGSVSRISAGSVSVTTALYAAEVRLLLNVSVNGTVSPAFTWSGEAPLLEVFTGFTRRGSTISTSAVWSSV